MGEASRRGTFAQRKELSIDKRKAHIKGVLDKIEKDEADLTPDQRIAQDKKRHAIMALINFARSSGMSAKELKRRMKRQNKKHI